MKNHLLLIALSLALSPLRSGAQFEDPPFGLGWKDSRRQCAAKLEALGGDVYHRENTLVARGLRFLGVLTDGVEVTFSRGASIDVAMEFTGPQKPEIIRALRAKYGPARRAWGGGIEYPRTGATELSINDTPDMIRLGFRRWTMSGPLPPRPANAPPALIPTDAKQYVGTRAVISGSVTRVRRFLFQPQVTLEVGGRLTNGGPAPFVVLVPEPVLLESLRAPNFSTAKATMLHTGLSFQVTGEITSDKGRPQIIVTKGEQLSWFRIKG